MKKLMYMFSALLLTGAIFTVKADAKKTASRSSDEQLNMKQLKVKEYFNGYDGTFILRNIKNGQTFVYNKERAYKRLTPESTFKVANALIGLQTGAVRDEYDVKRWDGIVREFDSWNRDHTLGSGMRESVIWYYQAMARDIGREHMEDWLRKISYGNQDISGGIDQFWLDSTLKISPLEQADFMEKLYEESLPFNKSVMKTVKRMMIQEETDSYILYGKTGTRLSDMKLGWFTGVIKNGGRTYVFATNINGIGSNAKAITHSILKKYRLIDE
ncbi:class D beta-lactamase [Bacillus swezeyi]|uniref:class D beta-lactamase n=1 Tax=Bacillus swezeyi TaxID=1925020 RepID=UPI0027DD4291|nr:class D beta-lactamase [Bacillus swezeyi]